MAVELETPSPTFAEQTRRSWAPTALAIVISFAYLLYVVHFSVNELFADEWDVVPMVHAALHGHLSFGILWAQHGENRMFVANVLFVFLGALTHYDTRVVVVLSALVFIATFALLLVLFRSYLQRPLTMLAVLAVGGVWFGLEDWQNSLFGFQLAWYLIVGFLMVMLHALLVSHRRIALPLSIACALGASFCSFQGLALWPVGIVCLIWMGAERRKIALWAAATVIGAGLYFWGYTSTPAVRYIIRVNSASVSPSFALHHPVQLAQFVLVDIGEVVPDGHLALAGALGAVILATAVFVVVQSIRYRRGCLPVALIIFGLLFDAFIAIGRIPFGPTAATASRYTIANLLIVVAVVVYGWVYFDRKWAVPGLLLLAVLYGLTTNSGLNGSRTFDDTLHTGARLVVNRDSVPPEARDCYSLYGFFVNVNPVPTTQSPLFNEAQEDRLGAFGAPYRSYHKQGLPSIGNCGG